MASGSQRTTWRQLGGKRPCSWCGRDFKITELSEYRRDVVAVDRAAVNFDAMRLLVFCDRDGCRPGTRKDVA